MVGYSRLMAADEVGTIARLKDLRREIFDPEVARAGGEIVKLTGDGMLVLFGSVVNAVEAAAAIQRTIASTETGAPDRRIRYRIGIHVGDVVVDEGEIYGDGVNIAARLEAQAEPGGVVVSLDACKQVRGKTALVFVDLGELALKNIPDPVRAFGIDLGGTVPRWSVPAARQGDAKPSIAVLPFQNMSADPEQEYFCDGVCEDIITELSRFPDLLVIARNSSFSFKGRSVTHREVARELGVRYMLEGSLRRAARRMRITAQLIDCETGAHVWAERYDRDIEDVFDLQDEITSSVVGAIAPQINKAELERAGRTRDLDFSSYDLALKAQAMFQAGAFADSTGHDKVLEIARRALELDPRNTHALWIRAYVYTIRYLYQFDDDPGQTLDLAEAAAERLFGTDRSDPRALTVRGMIRHFRNDFDAATADFRRAFDLNPNFALNIFLMAWHESLVGRTEEAREHALLALRLSPRDADIWVGDAYLALSQACFAERDFDAAWRWGERAIEMTPRAPIRRALMIAAAAHLGRPEQARPHAEALAGFAPAFLDSIVSGRLTLYRLREHNALLVDGLKKSGSFS
ncbi:TolB amino-terminal domain-containing protein [Ruegeria marina]|uniref:TolB amino-terminal domain-containing protein n=2 Tax=Ruegeria marina TaxID=639004 RepID=A0A1G6KPB4_9RHOB|nr:TolB amino-terminal domain-containing protein [Ruegeria marina]